jgi:hypothetical protein
VAKPTVPSDGQKITNAFLQATVDAPYAWQDHVNAGGKVLSNLGGLNLAPGVTLGILTYLSDVTLTAPTTVISSPVVSPGANTRLTVAISQDGTGGRAITWSADFVGPTTEIGTGAGETSVFQFVARSDGKWCLAARPLLGISGGAVSPAIHAGGAIYLADYTLTAASTEIVSPLSSPAAGAVLAVYLTQDATGGRAITWSADFVGPTTEIATGAGEISVFQFVARSDGNWWLSALPILGVA